MFDILDLVCVYTLRARSSMSNDAGHFPVGLKLSLAAIKPPVAYDLKKRYYMLDVSMSTYINMIAPGALVTEIKST